MNRRIVSAFFGSCNIRFLQYKKTKTCVSTNLPILLSLSHEQPLQILHVIMFEPLDSAARGLQSSLNCEIHAWIWQSPSSSPPKQTFVNKNYVSPLRVGRNRTGNCGESIAVEDCFFTTHESATKKLKLWIGVANSAPLYCSLLLKKW